ncbi:MAG: hypothetical protein GF317_12005 [Candidatus Lokiarchaeota archaeon]|nr:hypothetical protein [Candidatus Lokiarchaeota archaeon]MBD3200372.1 hypothetical protein [Candidatus Lokiarchaeota archaeon]
MADYHEKAFFGIETGIIIKSPAKHVPYIFITSIRRKKDGLWEKYSKGEGKTVKITIEEIICILEVLGRKSANWRGYHVFKEYKTEIYVGWEDETRNVVIFRIGKYEKKLRFPSTRFLTLLLEHVLTEKIEFATSGTYKEGIKEEGTEKDPDEYRVFSEQISARDGLYVVETTEYGVSVNLEEIEAKIKVESPKALLLNLKNNKEFWIPKSTIHSDYDPGLKNKPQKFMIEKWIIEKNLI